MPATRLNRSTSKAAGAAAISEQMTANASGFVRPAFLGIPLKNAAGAVTSDLTVHTKLLTGSERSNSPPADADMPGGLTPTPPPEPPEPAGSGRLPVSNSIRSPFLGPP